MLQLGVRGIIPGHQKRLLMWRKSHPRQHYCHRSKAIQILRPPRRRQQES